MSCSRNSHRVLCSDLHQFYLESVHPLCCFLLCAVQGRDVVVVDDIIDTGVRLQETVKLLKGAGARQYVNGLCFAFPCGIVYGSTKGFVSYGGHVGFPSHTLSV